MSEYAFRDEIIGLSNSFEELQYTKDLVFYGILLTLLIGYALFFV